MSLRRRRPLEGYHCGHQNIRRHIKRMYVVQSRKVRRILHYPLFDAKHKQTLYNWHTVETWLELPSHPTYRPSNRQHQHVLRHVCRVDGFYTRGHRSLSRGNAVYGSRRGEGLRKGRKNLLFARSTYTLIHCMVQRSLCYYLVTTLLAWVACGIVGMYAEQIKNQAQISHFPWTFSWGAALYILIASSCIGSGVTWDAELY